MVKLLRQVETLQDQTFAATGKLMAALVDARIEQGLSPVVGKQVRSAITRIATHASEGLGSASDAHRLLEALARSRGIDVSMYGDVDKHAYFAA